MRSSLMRSNDIGGDNRTGGPQEKVISDRSLSPVANSLYSSNRSKAAASIRLQTKRFELLELLDSKAAPHEQCFPIVL
ncbi:hypothetical protein WN944_024591 [Citrus x changshan-huyou]|uniref:Uncharacterized protein n=1 Tax=Citrus x changshan-huyou TaxID=2935761 RepID=A0AAP0LP72_9ROSI